MAHSVSQMNTHRVTTCCTGTFSLLHFLLVLYAQVQSHLLHEVLLDAGTVVLMVPACSAPVHFTFLQQDYRPFEDKVQLNPLYIFRILTLWRCQPSHQKLLNGGLVDDWTWSILEIRRLRPRLPQVLMNGEGLEFTLF